MDKVATINDVARRAGVSKGTVDRVVHNRGEVSEKTAAKVRKAIEELNYQPNLHAALLATKNEKVIACMIPEGAEGTYWGNVHDGLMSQQENAGALGVHLEMFFYDMDDLSSFMSTGEKVLGSNPDGVILAPLFMSEASSLAGKLHDKNIPYLFIDTKLEDENCLAYIGMPKYQSGYLCASVLTLKSRKEEVMKAAIIRAKRDKAGLSDPTVSRREGFLDFMTENYPGCEVINVMIDPTSSQEEIAGTISKALEGSGVRHIVVLNSRIHLISGFLENFVADGRMVVGFDALSKNLDMLRNGQVDVLITEKTGTMSMSAVRMMTEYLVLYKHPEHKDNHMHMDILTSLNLDNY